MIEIITRSVEQTIETGRKLGEILNGGDIVCLSGNLGAGKTSFAGGIASALGIGGYITSPTFTIVNEYTNGRIPLYHFDVYRIQDPDEMFEIGFEEYLDGEGVIVVEWPEVLDGILPQEHVHVAIEREPGLNGNERVIRIVFKGDRYKEYERSWGSMQGSRGVRGS